MGEDNAVKAFLSSSSRFESIGALFVFDVDSLTANNELLSCSYGGQKVWVIVVSFGTSHPNRDHHALVQTHSQGWPKADSSTVLFFQPFSNWRCYWYSRLLFFKGGKKIGDLNMNSKITFASQEQKIILYLLYIFGGCASLGSPMQMLISPWSKVHSWLLHLWF